MRIVLKQEIPLTLMDLIYVTIGVMEVFRTLVNLCTNSKDLATMKIAFVTVTSYLENQVIKKTIKAITLWVCDFFFQIAFPWVFKVNEQPVGGVL